MQRFGDQFKAGVADHPVAALQMMPKSVVGRCEIAEDPFGKEAVLWSWCGGEIQCVLVADARVGVLRN